MAIFQRINDQILGRNTWPPPKLRDKWMLVELYAAFRTSDETRIKQQASIPWQRRYLISPVPRMISKAKANLLFGEAPSVRAVAERDQENLDRLARENGLAGGHAPELHRAAMIASSEQEVFGRVYVDPSLADQPVIEFVSPRSVIPRFRGRFLVGATFVTEWRESSTTVIRLLEHYDPGVVRAELYRGSNISLGTKMPLDGYEATAGKLDVVYTGIDRPLVAFIPNSLDADPARGFGDYRGLEERFLAINEAATIQQENLRLAGKKRALLDAKYLRNGRLPDGDDVFIRSDSSAVAGEGGKPMQLIEYGFEAQQTIAYLDSLVDATLTYGGTAPQLVGRHVDGAAISGTALRLKMVHSLMEASGTGGHFDRGTQQLLRWAAVLDGRRTTEGGFGRRWQSPDEPPSITRGDGLPRDDMEAAQWLVMAAGAEAISLEEKVRWLHPDWSDDQVDDELGRIREEQGSTAAPNEEPPNLGPGGIPRPGNAPPLPGDQPPAQLPPGGA